MMLEYNLRPNGWALRAADQAAFSLNAGPENADWLRYQDWLALGNTPDAIQPTPAPVPPEISDRQFFQQLAVQGLISQDEALAAVKTGDIPVALRLVIERLPPGRQFEATMFISGATTVQRSHPLTVAIGGACGWTIDQIDGLFRAAAEL
jgi:hypothetical protein